MRWFRYHEDALDDPKVQTLPLHAFKVWVNLLTLTCRTDGKPVTISEAAFAFRETEESVSSAFHTLIEAGLIATDNETFHPKNWKKRQYKSDTSTERVRKHRKRFSNVTVTPPDTDSETEKKEDSANAESKRERAPAKRGTRLPPDWQPSTENIDFALKEGFTEHDAETIGCKFRDYWIAKSGRQGIKLDWDATWRNWVRGEGGGRVNGKSSAHERRKPASDTEIAAQWAAGYYDRHDVP